MSVWRPEDVSNLDRMHVLKLLVLATFAISYVHFSLSDLALLLPFLFQNLIVQLSDYPGHLLCVLRVFHLVLDMEVVNLHLFDLVLILHLWFS